MGNSRFPRILTKDYSPIVGHFFLEAPTKKSHQAAELPYNVNSGRIYASEVQEPAILKYVSILFHSNRNFQPTFHNHFFSVHHQNAMKRCTHKNCQTLVKRVFAPADQKPLSKIAWIQIVSTGKLTETKGIVVQTLRCKYLKFIF